MSSGPEVRPAALVDVLRPQPRQLGVWTLRAAAVVALVLGCSGVLAQLLFAQQSLPKWAVTVAGPAVVLGLSWSRRPVTYLAAVLIALLPFLRVAVSFKGASFPLSAPVFVVCVVVAFLVTRGSGAPRARSSSPLKVAALAALVLLLPSALRGTAVPMWFLQIAVVVALGYVVSRAWDLDAAAGSLVFPVIAGTLALQGLLAIHEYQTGRPLSFYGGESGYGASYFFSYGDDVFRPAGSFNDPISLGNFFAVGLPLLLALTTQRQQQGVLRRSWYAACALIAAGALVLTFSRMSWVGATAGVVVVVVLSPSRERLRQAVLLAGGAVVVSLTTVALAGGALTSRFDSIFHPTAIGVRTAQGDEVRQQLWAAAADTFSRHPLFGVGHGYLHALLLERVGGTVDTHAHSTYLQILAEAGVLGGVALLVLFSTTAVVVVRRVGLPFHGDVVAVACAGAAAAILAAWTTDYTIRFTEVLAWMALPFILMHATRTSPEVTRPATAQPEAAVGARGSSGQQIAPVIR